MHFWRDQCIMQECRQETTLKTEEEANTLSLNLFLFDLLPVHPLPFPSGCFCSLHLWVTSTQQQVSGSEVLMQLSRKGRSP